MRSASIWRVTPQQALSLNYSHSFKHRNPCYFTNKPIYKIFAQLLLHFILKNIISLPSLTLQLCLQIAQLEYIRKSLFSSLLLKLSLTPAGIRMIHFSELLLCPESKFCLHFLPPQSSVCILAHAQ